MTFTGAVVGWTPITTGASGRARCRNEGISTAMLGNRIEREEGSKVGVVDVVDLVENSPPSSSIYTRLVGFVGDLQAARALHPKYSIALQNSALTSEFAGFSIRHAKNMHFLPGKIKCEIPLKSKHPFRLHPSLPVRFGPWFALR